MFSKNELAEIECQKDPIHRLGFAVLLVYLKQNGCFPEKANLVNGTLVVDIAEFITINPKLWRDYHLSSRTAFRHRKRIKELLKFKSASGSYKKRYVDWLANNMELGTNAEEAEEILRGRFLHLKTIAPNRGIIIKIAQKASFKLESGFFQKISQSLTKQTKKVIDQLLENSESMTFADLKKDPGRVSLESIKLEARKLSTLQNIGVEDSLLKVISKSYLSKIKRRVISESIHELKRHPSHTKYALLAIFTYIRQREITDDMVDLLIHVIHKIGARAERKITKEFIQNFKKVRNKEGVLRDVFRHRSMILKDL